MLFPVSPSDAHALRDEKEKGTNAHE